MSLSPIGKTANRSPDVEDAGRRPAAVRKKGPHSFDCLHGQAARKPAAECRLGTGADAPESGTSQDRSEVRLDKKVA